VARKSHKQPREPSKPKPAKPRSVEYEDPAGAELCDAVMHEFERCPFCDEKLKPEPIALHLLDCQKFPAREVWREACRTVQRYRAEREARAKAGIPEAKN
jgi:hypothetical protein